MYVHIQVYIYVGICEEARTHPHGACDIDSRLYTTQTLELVYKRRDVGKSIFMCICAQSARDTTRV